MSDHRRVGDSAAFREAFRQHELANRISTGRVAALLVATLMPFGWSLDWVVYPERVVFFGLLRVICSLLAIGIWLLLHGPWGRKNHGILGLITAWLPALFICLMIYDREGPTSPYYAGLNLILLAISVVVRWDTVESVIAVGGVLVLFLVSCLLHTPLNQLNGLFAANCIFMVETGIIVVVGNHFFNRLRYREFSNQYELALSKRELEEAIRRLREAEAQLVQQEKMASLGVLSAGIIHEINNPLNFAATNLYALRKRLAGLEGQERQALEEIIADVEDGLGRVRDIVSDLRTFTHPETESLEAVEVAEAVHAAVRYLSGERPDSVRVEVDVPGDLAVRGSRNKLVHVLINLVENSLDALRQKEFREEVPTVRISSREEGGRVIVEVWDNGPGIAPEHQGRIFDPFFTTKDVGEGMGLGLSICYRLLQECGASIRVESEPGRFCRFILEFPPAAAHAGSDSGPDA